MYAIKENTKKHVLCWYYRQKNKFIIHPGFMVANHKITDQFIQNLKSNPNKVHELTGEMKRSLKKQKLEKSIKPQIHKLTCITDNNGKTDYFGSTYANHLVALEPGCIREKFEFREPELYKLVTTVTCDKTKHKTYNVPVGRCALHTSGYVPNFVDMHHNALICVGESNKKEEPSKISEKKTLTHCSWWNYHKIFTSQPQFMYYIILGIIIVLYG